MLSNFNGDQSPLLFLSLMIIVFMQSRESNLYTKVDPVQMSMGAYFEVIVDLYQEKNDTRRLFDGDR